MCGICGYLTPETINPAVLGRMLGRLRHRGPDEEGVYHSFPAALGHRRLCIIDKSGSRQPLFNEDRTLVLIYNGELYNFQELRQELLRLGHHFTTNGDSEVLIHAYEEYGPAMLKKTAGMFAFALWDEKNQSLFMARDQIGVKPLHYYWDGQTFVFASELKALMEHPAVSRQIDLDALGLYLQCQYIPAPLSVFHKVRKLPPGHWLSLKDGRLDIQPYWRPDYRDKLDLTEEDAVRLLEESLKESVRGMLISDVPLGAFISGGIDSGLVAALMTDISGRKIETFNLGFKDRLGAKSEHLEAEAVARHLSTHHHTLMIDSSDILENVAHLTDIFDEPFADNAALPTMMLAKLTRQYVTVVLTGEGADEVFSGYGNYQKRVREERWTGLLGGRWSPLKAMVALLPARWQKDRFLFALGQPTNRRHVTIPNLIHESRRRTFFTETFWNGLKTRLSDWAAKYYDECNSEYYLDRILHVDLRLWLPDDLLTKVDRATMAYSLEARVPYLDHRFLEITCRLDPGLKQHGPTTKYILKKLAEKYLPFDIVHRPKQGFVFPLAEWLRTNLRDYCRNFLSPERVQRRGLLRPEVVAGLLNEHLSGRKNNSFRLWSFLILELWFDRYQPDFEL